MRLLGVELSRFVSRMLAISLIVVLVGAAGAGLIAWQSAKPLPENLLAEFQADFDRYHEEWEANHQEEYESCLEEQEAVQVDEPGGDFGCEFSLEEPQFSEWVWQPTFALEGVQQVSGMTVAFLLLVALVAVSFVSAEFSTGSIGTWLR